MTDSDIPPFRVTLSGVLEIALVLVASATIGSFFAEPSWLLELFSHFPLQYLFISTTCALVLAWLGRRRTALLAALLAAVNLAVLLEPQPLGQRTATSVTDGPRLSLLLANVQRVNRLHDLVIHYVTVEQPDILAVLEIDSAWRRDLDAKLATYPHRLVRTREDNFGIGIYSKAPLIDPEVLDLNGTGVASLLVRVMLGGKPVRVLATHPVPPTDPSRAEDRNRQLAAIARMTATSSTPIIVLGDLNLTPWSPRFRTLLDNGGLTDSRIGFGHHATWPTWFSLLGIPIDHVLVGRGIKVYSREVGPAIGSDHYPVLVEVGT